MENKNTTDETFNTVVEPHNHRAIIGFDKNGIPKVLVPSAVILISILMKTATNMNTAMKKSLPRTTGKRFLLTAKPFQPNRMCLIMFQTLL